jgi:methionyl-tRNA formyltransferase
MNKIKVVFLGGRPIGSFAIELLEKISNVEIIGCVTKLPSENAWWKGDPHEYVSNKYPCLELGDLDKLDFDFGVSINYWKVIPSNIVSKPRLGFINLHHSYNLSYKGRDMTTHVIRTFRKKSQLYHGTTLHYTDDGLDTGPAIASLPCDISESDTAWSLFNKVEKVGEKLLEYWLPKLVLNKAPTMKPEVNDELNFRQDLNRELPHNMSPVEVYDFVRSLDFNNFFEPAYMTSNGIKHYLTISELFGGKMFLYLGNERKVYFNDDYQCIS